MGTNDRVLMRVVVTRCEVDMVQIKQEFQTKYHKTLDNFIDVSINRALHLLLHRSARRVPVVMVTVTVETCVLPG